MFDTDRSADHIRKLQGTTDKIADFGNLPLRIDDTGETVETPLRLVNSIELGLALEIGPYSISVDDAAQLRAVLDEFLSRCGWASGSSDQAG